MAKGNFYVLVNNYTLNDALPNSLHKTFYGVHSAVKQRKTWEELASDQKQKHGVLRSNVCALDEQTYYIIELELSHVTGDADSLIKLSQQMDFPNLAMLTAGEAARFRRYGATA